MTELFTRIFNFFSNFKLMFVVLPWERAARVRLGKHVRLLDAGWHVRLPFVDEVFPLNTRLRIADTGQQTLTTADGHAATFGLQIGFRITDPLRALLAMQHPEQSCAAIASSALARVVSETARSALCVAMVEARVSETLAAEAPYDVDFVRIRDFVFARTYRVLNENNYRDVGVRIEERKV